MDFTKIQGAGNDFIVIDNREGAIPRDTLGALAKRLCTRRISIGADGMLVVENPERGCDFKMEYFNCDGSLGEMCGNGARCMARYAYDKGLSAAVQRFETTAGIIEGERIDERNYRIKLNDVSVLRQGVRVRACGRDYVCGYAELGDPGIPHAAVEIPGLADADREDLRVIAAAIRSDREFPKGANVNFYDVIGKDEVEALTYERGVEDFTLACGTGSASLVALLKDQGRVGGRGVSVRVPGGLLVIDLQKTDEGAVSPYLTGPTNTVAEGVVMDEELREIFHLRQRNLHRIEK